MLNSTPVWGGAHTVGVTQGWNVAPLRGYGDRAPWLVNAIPDQIANRDVEDRKVAITAEHVEAATETTIVERRSHIDSLLARLSESRVRQILEPTLAGGWVAQDLLNDDFAYVAQLGLIALRSGVWEVANPIYREISVVSSACPEGAGHAGPAQRPGYTETEGEALEQIDRYLDSAGLQEGWLALLGRRLDGCGNRQAPKAPGSSALVCGICGYSGSPLARPFRAVLNTPRASLPPASTKPA